MDPSRPDAPVPAAASPRKQQSISGLTSDDLRNFSADAIDRAADKFVQRIGFSNNGQSMRARGNSMQSIRDSMKSTFFDSDESDDDDEIVDDWLAAGDDAPELDSTAPNEAPKISKDERQGEKRYQSIAALQSITIAKTLAYSRAFVDELRETKFVRVLKLAVNGRGKKMVNDYEISCELGHGAYGKVLLLTKDDVCFACKLVVKPTAAPSNLERMRQSSAIAKMGNQSKHPRDLRKCAAENNTVALGLSQEVEIMKKLRHPNVLSLYEVIDDPKDPMLYLILEFGGKGALVQDEGIMATEVQMHEAQPDGGRLKSDRYIADESSGTISEPMSLQKVRKYMQGAVCGLEYLHAQNIVHADIKPENLLLNQRDEVKLCDFGISHVLTTSDMTLNGSNGGTPAFEAPEICSGQQYLGQPADIWALGVTVFVLVHGRLPFVGSTLADTFSAIQTKELIFPAHYVAQCHATEEVKATAAEAAHALDGSVDGSGEVSGDVSRDGGNGDNAGGWSGVAEVEQLHQMIRSMLTKQPEARISLAALRQHPWLTNNGAEPLLEFDNGRVAEQTDKMHTQQAELSAKTKLRKLKMSLRETFVDTDCSMKAETFRRCQSQRMEKRSMIRWKMLKKRLDVGGVTEFTSPIGS
jgi:[calcium/calmodulin-dependent protein kinase] kinase